MVLAACVHPDKQCFAFQVAHTSLIVLFLNDKTAEEVKLTFSKAKKIHRFSFLTGDRFNFVVATDLSIDLYKITVNKQSTKLVQSITVPTKLSPSFFLDTISNIIVVCDSNFFCYPYFLN